MKPKTKLYLTNCALAFQHLFAVLGGVVVVPVLLKMETSMGLFCSGLGTVLFYFVCKRQVPVFHGSSSTYLAGLQALMKNCIEKNHYSHESYVARQAIAIIISGVVYFIIAVIVYFVGPQRISKLFPPIVVGPIVMAIGLPLCPKMIDSNIVSSYDGPKAKFHSYQVWIIAVITMAVIVGMTCFAPGIWNCLGIIFGIVAGYIASACFQVIDYSQIKSSNWILFQPEEFKKTFWFWKEAKWDWGAIGMIIPLAIVALMEHLGDVSTNSSVCGKDFFVEPGLHRTIAGDGCALVAAGFLGAPPMATYSQNTGVLVITRNFNPDVLAIAGGYAMFLGLITKVGAIFNSIPSFVIGAASSMMFAIIGCMGIKVLIMNNVDISKSRNLMISALILLIGIGFPYGRVDTSAGDVEISPVAIATLVGVILNLCIPEKKGNADHENNSEMDSEEAKRYESEYSEGKYNQSMNEDEIENSSESSENNTVQDLNRTDEV
ncbi:hypothetical protein M9Y10_032591 [Tritrichomonas musculus]|uniref:Uracil permease n=1 Tax=Tritrichomonas musculus TaxID=1915356 RepID=A0ABR2GYV6_9EUKA